MDWTLIKRQKILVFFLNIIEKFHFGWKLETWLFMLVMGKLQFNNTNAMHLPFWESSSREFDVIRIYNGTNTDLILYISKFARRFRYNVRTIADLICYLFHSSSVWSEHQGITEVHFFFGIIRIFFKSFEDLDKIKTDKLKQGQQKHTNLRPSMFCIRST